MFTKKTVGQIFNLKNILKNIDTRKFFGTIIGGIFFLCCVVYFTYAYYEWKSDETSIALTIHEADVKCTMGPNIDVSNIGPVLKLGDGVKSSFGIENSFTDDMVVSVILDITSISESLLNESFKWAIVQDKDGGDNFDYDNPIIEGNFKNFREGSNLITTALQVPAQTTVNYEFIVYIDGNVKNDISIMNNSMEASLTLGNCGTDYIRYDELIQFAFYSADDNSLSFTYDYPVAVGDIYLGKTVTKLYTGYDTTKYNSASAVPWYADGNYDDIVRVTFLETTTPTSTAFWFSSFKNVESIDLEKLDTSGVTKMSSMFAGCERLVTLNVDMFQTSNVIDMDSMFEGCQNIIELDLSCFNTSNVTAMNKPGRFSYGGMFRDCRSLNSLDISSFDTSKLKSFGNMFNGCSSLIELDVSNFDTSSATDMGGMFGNCTSLIELDVSNFDTSSVTDMSNMFAGCKNIIEFDLSCFDTSKVSSIYNIFQHCTSLIELDVSNFDTSNVTGMSNMFNGCSSLIELDLSNFDTSNVTGMSNMFHGCSSLIELDLSNFDTSNVTNINKMFNGCSSLIELDVSNFDTSSVTDMNNMFNGCSSLIELDLSNFDTSNVTNMVRMFMNCTSLIELDVSNFDTSNVTSMELMFYFCHSLVTSITISNPKTIYNSIFTGISTNASITLYYIGDNPNTTDVNESTESLVNNMKGTNTRVFIGGCKGDYCPVVDEETV